MEIKVGKLCGFCAGVNYTVKKAIEELENSNDTVYCLGEIIHNERVIKKLEDMGMITVEHLDEVPDGSKVIFRAHGEAQSTYEFAKSHNLEVIDLTCGKVRLVHNKVAKERPNSFIIIIGKLNHPETMATLGYADPNGSYVVENEEDIAKAIEAFNHENYHKIYIVVQTTFNDALFDSFVKKIKEQVNTEVVVDKTICDATKNRQEETRSMAKEVNKMIIIGGKHSSNTKELAMVAQENCSKVYLVQELEDLKDVEFNENDKVGITAGASTPQESIDEIVNYLKENYNAKEV